MARKSKRDDLAPVNTASPEPVAVDPGRQPRIVGWLILIVGSFSSWYWYRPIPETVKQTVHATSPSAWATSGPNSLWTDQTLVLPSTEGAVLSRNEFPGEASLQSNEDSQLVGIPHVTLVPWNDAQQDIREVLKTERVPMVPISPNFNEFSRPASPQIWTPDQQLSNRIGGISNSKPNWPDAGYVPPQKALREQRRSATQITTQIPKLLEAGLKSIRTEEMIDSAPSTVPIEPAGSSSIPDPPPATRQPQFIRQPRASN